MMKGGGKRGKKILPFIGIPNGRVLVHWLHNTIK